MSSSGKIPWRTSIAAAKKEDEIRTDILNGVQTIIDDFNISEPPKFNDTTSPDFNPAKTIQTSFIGGEQFMQQNPDLNDDVTDIPEQETIRMEVKEWFTGQRDEIYDIPEDEELKYGERDDKMLQIVLEATYNGNTITHQETFRYYQNPDPRSSYGAFLRRYGQLEEGKEVNVDFDSSSDGSIVLPN